MELIKVYKMSSLELAELTCKTHANLMKSIRKMEDSWVKLGQVKFDLTSYKDEWNRIQPVYQLSKTECLFIATKFNDEMRAKVILRWEELETLKRNSPLAKFQNDPFIQLRMSQIEQQDQIDKLESKVQYIEAKTTTRPDYFSVMGYAVFNKITIGLHLAATIGRKASSICKTKGYPTDEVPDPRFGKVKLYPQSVLKQIINEAIV